MNSLVLGSPVGKELFRQAYPEEQFDYAGFTELKTRKTNYYDTVISFHYLNTLGMREYNEHLAKLYKVMKPEGVLTLFVPSLEWAAEQILAENPSPITMVHLFGYQKDKHEFYRSGYTMRALRRDLDKNGFAVSHAKVGFYELELAGADGKPVPVEAAQHVLIAVKRKDGENVPYQTVEK